MSAPAIAQHVERVTDADTGRRYYVHPVTEQRLTSVTTVLGGTTSKSFLIDWSAKLAATFAANNLALLQQLAATSSKQAVIDLIKGETKRQRDAKAAAGSLVHDLIEALIKWHWSSDGTGGEIAFPDVPEDLADFDMDGIPLSDFVKVVADGFINWVTAFDPEFIASEMTVLHSRFNVAGTLDLIVQLRDVAIGKAGRLVPAPGNVLVLCVDIKTGKNLDETMPEQLACYRRMDTVCLPMGQLGAMPRTDAGAVLHLRPEHDGGFKFMLISGEKDAAAWNRFRRALELYTGRREESAKPGKVIYPLRADGTVQSPRLVDLDGEGYRHAPKALAKHDFVTLEDVARKTGAELLALKGIGPAAVPLIEQMLTDHGLALASETPLDDLAGAVA